MHVKVQVQDASCLYVQESHRPCGKRWSWMCLQFKSWPPLVIHVMSY